MYEKLVTKHTGTGADLWIEDALRPEFISEYYGLEDDSVTPLDAPDRVPAGGCYRYIPIYHGAPFGLQASASR